MTNRNLVFLALTIIAIWLPWWFAAALLVGAILLYQDFFEAIIILFYLDLVYSTGLAGARGYFLMTLTGLTFLLVVEVCRKAMLMRD